MMRLPGAGGITRCRFKELSVGRAADSDACDGGAKALRGKLQLYGIGAALDRGRAAAAGQAIAWIIPVEAMGEWGRY